MKKIQVAIIWLVQDVHINFVGFAYKNIINIIIDIGQLKDVLVKYKYKIVWANGRFKTRKEITNPDRMRKIYLIPRILLFAIRPVIIFTKLTLKAARKSFFTPLKKINKTVFRRAKPK